MTASGGRGAPRGAGTAPRVLNKRSGRQPADAVYVGRPTKWGNPFVIGADFDRQSAIDSYRGWLEIHPELIEAARIELRGRDLVCWCAPQACHADVLLEVANS